MRDDGFVKINDYSKIYNVPLGELYYYARVANEKGLTDRSRIIDGKYYIHRDYKAIDEREIRQMQDLYYKALDLLYDDESLLLKLIHLRCEKSHMAIHMYFKHFSFSRTESRIYYKKILEDIIQNHPFKNVCKGNWIKSSRYSNEIGISSQKLYNFYRNYQDKDKNNIFLMINNYLYINKDKLKVVFKNKKSKQYVSFMVI